MSVSFPEHAKSHSHTANLMGRQTKNELRQIVYIISVNLILGHTASSGLAVTGMQHSQWTSTSDNKYARQGLLSL